MDKVKIKISKVGRKQMPSKFKEGETYNITTVMDEITGRKGQAMGAWSDVWKVGDIVEGIWEEKKYTDKDGFEQKSWKITNPDKKEFKGGGSYGPRKATLVDAYTIAALLAPLLYKDKKILKFEDIAKLADEIMKKVEVIPATPAATAEKVKTVDLDKEEKAGKKEETVDKDFDVDTIPAKGEDDVDDEDIFS